MDWLGAPDQGARTRPLRRLGRNGREIELTDRPVGQRAAAATSVCLPASGDGEEAAGAAGRLHVQRSTISLFVWLVADG
jgi:hypothetical protein